MTKIEKTGTQVKTWATELFEEGKVQRGGEGTGKVKSTRSEDRFESSTSVHSLTGARKPPLLRPKVGWMGLPRSIIGRGPPFTETPLAEGFTYDSWVRQRAVVQELRFEAWAPGVTDWDNPDMWKQLDAKIHYRFSDSGPFQSKAVNIVGRSDENRGHNAIYAVNLGDFDPYRAHQPNPPSEEATAMQFYFSINGTEFRPAPNEAFTGKFLRG